MNTKFAIQKSELIKGIEWVSERLSYPEPDIKGDTFPMTWADDDEIYSSAGDPLWGESSSGLDIEKFSGVPENYRITKVNHMNDYIGWGGDGPKPSGMICVDGVLYLAFQNMLKSKKAPYSIFSQHGSDAQIVYSTNKGGFWVPALRNISEPMFFGHKFGGPAFVNFGKNNANSRDNYIYAISTDQWDNGSNLRIGRVPSQDIVHREAWEWVSGYDVSGKPVWNRNLEEAIPILSLYRWISLPEMVYLAGVERYLLLTWHLHKDFSPVDGTDLLVFESPEPWGPFFLVHFEEYWEGKDFNPYCPRIPLKWMESDGITGWIQFSGSWGNEGQRKGYYRSNVRKFRLKLK
ncbi:MAG TPA: hypothetical protein P5239_07660 [Victivallales bacterium]|nr:hypothetical protein [Victivallales bacterium]HRU01564.1 hypothetical protein [Victivallales bacterium]